MTIQIHGDLGSGSFRRVATAAKIMGVDIEHINVDLFKGESHTPVSAGVTAGVTRQVSGLTFGHDLGNSECQT